MWRKPFLLHVNQKYLETNWNSILNRITNNYWSKQLETRLSSIRIAESNYRMIAQWTTQSRTIAWNKKPIQFRRSLRDRRGPPIKSRLVRACRPTCTRVQKGWQTFRGCSLIPAPHGCQSTSEASSQKPSLVTFIPPTNPPSSSSGGIRFLTREWRAEPVFRRRR